MSRWPFCWRQWKRWENSVLCQSAKGRRQAAWPWGWRMRLVRSGKAKLSPCRSRLQPSPANHLVWELFNPMVIWKLPLPKQLPRKSLESTSEGLITPGITGSFIHFLCYRSKLDGTMEMVHWEKELYAFWNSYFPHQSLWLKNYRSIQFSLLLLKKLSLIYTVPNKHWMQYRVDYFLTAWQHRIVFKRDPVR